MTSASLGAQLPVEAAYEQYQRNEITYAEYRVIADREEVIRTTNRRREISR